MAHQIDVKDARPGPVRAGPSSAPNSLDSSRSPGYLPTTHRQTAGGLLKIRPDEIYNLGAQSHLRVSFDVPEYAAEVPALGVLRLLEGLRESGLTKIHFYQASSSEMFGSAPAPEGYYTPFHPRSP